MAEIETPGPGRSGVGGDAQSGSGERPQHTRPAARLQPWQADFLTAQRCVRQRHRDQMASWGVTPAAQIRCGLYGVAPVRIDKLGRFYLAEDGQPAFLLPVFDGPTSGGDYSRCPVRDVLDFVAWLAADPAQFWTLRGESWALGADQAGIAAWADSGPLTVHQSPVAWLRAGCRGCCVLDWSSDGPSRLGRANHLIAANRDHAAKLKRWTTPTVRVPRISFRQGRRAAA